MEEERGGQKDRTIEVRGVGMRMYEFDATDGSEKLISTANGSNESRINNKCTNCTIKQATSLLTCDEWSTMSLFMLLHCCVCSAVCGSDGVV